MNLNENLYEAIHGMKFKSVLMFTFSMLISFFFSCLVFFSKLFVKNTFKIWLSSTFPPNNIMAQLGQNSFDGSEKNKPNVISKNDRLFYFHLTYPRFFYTSLKNFYFLFSFFSKKKRIRRNKQKWKKKNFSSLHK